MACRFGHGMELVQSMAATKLAIALTIQYCFPPGTAPTLP